MSLLIWCYDHITVSMNTEKTTHVWGLQQTKTLRMDVKIHNLFMP